jgi:N-dimethylarginine dimethylaminohydrolase
MLFDFDAAENQIGDSFINAAPQARWGVDSEYARLTQVMISAPRYLEIVPCNSVSIRSREEGLSCTPRLAAAQHESLVAALEDEGVRCHFVPPHSRLPDLSFTRDCTLMTPWGLLGLGPGVAHRAAEVEHILSAARSWGVPTIGSISEGKLEGGDVCLLRPGTIVIGYSGERTDRTGAEALARIFEERGWRAIFTGFDPQFLHLDTQITMIDRDLAVACVEVLDSAFLLELQELGIRILPASYEEVQKLGANLLSLGGRRVVSPADNVRVNRRLEQLGYHVHAIDVDQFTRCGGGIHCLTMPLARAAG